MEPMVKPVQQERQVLLDQLVIPDQREQQLILVLPDPLALPEQLGLPGQLGPHLILVLLGLLALPEQLA